MNILWTFNISVSGYVTAVVKRNIGRKYFFLIRRSELDKRFVSTDDSLLRAKGLVGEERRSRSYDRSSPTNKTYSVSV